MAHIKEVRNVSSSPGGSLWSINRNRRNILLTPYSMGYSMFSLFNFVGLTGVIKSNNANLR